MSNTSDLTPTEAVARLQRVVEAGSVPCWLMLCLDDDHSGHDPDCHVERALAGLDFPACVAALSAPLVESVRRVLEEVEDERKRQDRKWGEQNHAPFVYLAIIQEEVGEAAQAALKAVYEGGKTLADYREELIQAAACCVAAVECLDRGKWNTQEA